MKFCPVCNNIYYIQIDADSPNSIMHYCRNCGETDKSVASDSMVVSSVSPQTGTAADSSRTRPVSKYMVYDPTLPRMTDMLCPNDACSSNSDKATSEDREILYICTNMQMMQYSYMCAKCDMVWKVKKD